MQEQPNRDDATKSPASSWDDSLSELERLLEEETVALRKLDREAIDRIAESKTSLCGRLAACGASAKTTGPAPVAKARLERIKRRALYNQVLLVHARDSVRGVLALFTGEDSSGERASSHDGLRLSVRV